MKWMDSNKCKRIRRCSKYSEERKGGITMTENTSQTERIMFPCTTEFKNELEQISTQQNVSVSTLIKKVCIETLKMKSKLPNNSRGKVSKYSTPEERERANKLYRQNRYNEQREALKHYRESLKK